MAIFFSRIIQNIFSIGNISEIENKKTDHLLLVAQNQFNIQSDALKVIDSKVIWVFGFISLTQGYLMVKYLLEDWSSLSTMSSVLGTLVCLVGLVLLSLCLYVLSVKKFKSGPDSSILTQKFWGSDYSILDLKKDHLASLNESTNKNHRVITKKSSNLKYITYIIIVYYIIIILFFINLMMADEIKNNNNTPPLESSSTTILEFGEKIVKSSPPLNSDNVVIIEKTDQSRKE